MKQVYNHHTHSYEYRPSHHAIVERLGNMRGAHNDKIADAQPSGLFLWVLIAFLAVAWFTKEEAQPEQLMSMCLMGVCL